MKTTIIGLVVALVTGLLVYTSMNLTNEQFAMFLGCVLFVPAVYLIRMRKIESSRTEQMIQQGLNHYRTHVHDRRLIKKTS
jgi:small neutral amino acid transporter SnatA (MarC family)